MEGDAPFQPNFSISFGPGAPFANRPVVETLLKCRDEVGMAIEQLADAYFSPDNVLPTA